jgi:predicted dinucleotide-binding enzyme
VDIAVIGTGFIGGILGRALSSAGHHVTFGSRHAEGNEVGADASTCVTSIGDALTAADVVILALPGAALPDLAAQYCDELNAKLVIDATNQMGQPAANGRAALPATVRYARAFNTLGGENLADPTFADGPADMFFSAPQPDRATVETVIQGVGLRPVYLGEDQEHLVDALFRIWIALAVTQGRGRRLALRLIDH